MGAREKFQKGDRIQFTEEWMRQSGYKMRFGTVVGFSLDNRGVRVTLDNAKSPHTYSPNFVEHVPSLIPTPSTTTNENTRWSARREGLVEMK